MKQLQNHLVFSLILMFLVAGCAGSSGPGIPSLDQKAEMSNCKSSNSQTHVWGYYDVYIDIENQIAYAVENRQASFTVNVVNILNGKPGGLSFYIHKTPTTMDYVDIDIDVSISHPFPGLPQYHGYDVRGIFMGNGSANLQYNGALSYPVFGTDQFMFPDPEDNIGGPDGYTRWFNKTEFSTGGMPLFQYTHGKLATPAYSPTATLNPYKYFADGLKAQDDLWTWLNANSSQNGRFSSGAKNTRNYYLRFMHVGGQTVIKYGYAVIANWEGVEPQYHPSNAPEAVACKVTDSSNVWFNAPGQSGGNLILDISLFGWKYQPSAIFIESTVLSSPYELTPDEMVPVGGTGFYSTYHVEIPADKVTTKEGNEYWVIAQYDDFDYSNDFGVSNLAEDDPLAAFFRYNLSVGTGTAAWIKVLVPNGGEVWIVDSYQNITWQSGGNINFVKIEYSKDNFVSDIHQIVASTENDGSFNWKIPDDPSNTVRVRISDASNASIYDISDNNFTIEPASTDCGTGIHNTLKYEGQYQLNWSQAPYPSWLRTYDIASMADGRVLIQGMSGGAVALMAFDVTQNGLVNGQVLISSQWGSDQPNWIPSMDVCDVTGNIAFILATNYGKMLIFSSNGNHIVSLPSARQVFAAVDTDWEGNIWTIEYYLNSDPTPMGIQAFIERYTWTGTTYVYEPGYSLEITKDLELNPHKVAEIGIVFSEKRLLLIEHSSYPWKGNIYSYDISGKSPKLIPELTRKNFLSSPLSESQIGHWRKAFDIEIDHSDLSKERCRIIIGRRSGSGWTDGSYLSRYDTDMNLLAEYHIPGTATQDHLLESFTLCPNPKDPDGIFLTIHEGWLSHPNMDRFEVYAMPSDW